MKPYINVYFRRPDGSQISFCSLPVGAWLPQKGDPITVCEDVMVKRSMDGGPNTWEERRTKATVTAVAYELYYVKDGEHSEVRYVVEVSDATP